MWHLSSGSYWIVTTTFLWLLTTSHASAQDKARSDSGRTYLSYPYYRTVPALPSITGPASAGDIKPYVEHWAHGGGNLQVSVSNDGTFTGYLENGTPDPLTGERIQPGVYPHNSGILYGSLPHLWVGAIVDQDTLVSTAFPYYPEILYALGGEFWPETYPLGKFRIESINSGTTFYSRDARSELDLICEYMDTLTRSDLVTRFETRPHIPLGLKVTQRSMSWTAPLINDFILVDYSVENIGAKHLKQVCVGFAAGAYAAPASDTVPLRPDNLGGFLKSYPAPEGCYAWDTVNIAYGMDNDGDPVNGAWARYSPTGAVGICILKTPIDSPVINYNWKSFIFHPYPYSVGFEPRRRGTPGDPFRTAGSGFDRYGDDAGKYYLMHHREFDYDQLFANVDYTTDGWMPPDPICRELAGGGWTDFLLSFGAFDLGPGQKANFTIAIVGGENVIAGPNDYANRYYPDDPSIYYSGLNFSDLALNTRWAKWVYDNPGVDTDGDGYFGKFRVCDGDTQWYEGDGVPDFRADVPPPSPKLKVIPSAGSLAIRWNGYYSETAIDPFTKVKDFEGYRVYAGLDDRESSMSLLISWDYENFNRYAVLLQPNGTYAWINRDLPLTLDSLRALYGDGFSPLLYTRDNPWHWNDTLYSFEQVDYNMSQFSPTGVHKVYPEARQLGTDTLQWTPDDLTTEHGEPLPKYYEYEYVFNNVLPTIAQYISVTAFDFGFAKGNIPAKESNKLSNRIIAYAQTSADSVETKDLNVYVYPNPYLFNVNYAAQGYENHDNSQIRDRSHRLNFGNLPPKCRISIYSLDGDLIRSWEHDYSPTDPQAMHDSWDLITRNTMLPAAGLYYWTVESPTRTQIGKFVIIE